MKTLLLSALLLVPYFAQADMNTTEAKRKDCLHRSSSTEEMKACEYKAYREADAELNRVYQKTLDKIEREQAPDSKELKTRLVNAKNAWVTFRDANCSLKSGEMIGGSNESLLLASCAVNTTLDRVKELQSLL